MLVSFSINIYATYKFPDAAFYLLPSRSWELLLGAFVALMKPSASPKPWLDGLLLLAGLTAILYSVITFSESTSFPGYAALVPVLGSVVLIYACGSSPKNLVAYPLSTKPLVFIGLISYSLYLWHWPIIVYSKMYSGHLGWKPTTFAVLISFLLAILSWHWIDRPFAKSGCCLVLLHYFEGCLLRY